MRNSTTCGTVGATVVSVGREFVVGVAVPLYLVHSCARKSAVSSVNSASSAAWNGVLCRVSVVIICYLSELDAAGELYLEQLAKPIDGLSHVIRCAEQLELDRHPDQACSFLAIVLHRDGDRTS